MMSTPLRCVMRLLVLTIVTILGAGMAGRASAAPCIGDCDGGGSVSVDEITKIIMIILEGDSSASGCGAVPGGCVNADANGDGTIQAGELTHAIANRIN